MLDFDPITHTYRLNGAIVPSVTQILAGIGFIDATWFTEYGRERGTLVHRIIHWHIDGTLDESSIDPALQGYFDAWRRFEVETGFVSYATEKPLVSEPYRFAGTPDHIGTMPIATGEILVDCKTGAVMPWVGLQLAAYEILHGRRLQRLALRLKEDGKYSSTTFTDKQDRGIFLAALSCYQWQKNHGR